MPGPTSDHWRSLTAAQVADRTGWSAAQIDRLTTGVRPADVDVALPTDDEVRELGPRLAFAAPDLDSTLAARPDPERHPELWWLLAGTYRRQLDRLGRPLPGHVGWPEPPERTGPVGRHLLVWVCLALVPRIRELHAALGLSEEESWDSLAGLGDEVASGRDFTGRPGLDATWGMPLLFGGVSYRLGRLAFDRQPAHPDAIDHGVLRPGESGLNTHVPSGDGPLTDAACDASFARAAALADSFPEPVTGFGCHSWLMDPQLADYLPESSNIMRFQRRFTWFTDRERADWAPIHHLFRRRFEGPGVPPALLDEVPQDTTLQRAIITHLRRGGHWNNQTGWFRIEGR